MIYLDNAATTKINEKALEVYNYYSKVDFFNPSAVYAIKNSLCLSQARQTISRKLGFDGLDNVIFTASASEANNLAFSCVANDYVISNGEHPSVYNMALHLKENKRVLFCPLSQNGEVNYSELEKLLSSETKFISVMHVSNETGAINDLEKISKMRDEICPGAILHVDGVQAFCKIDFNMKKSGVDLYTISGHKIGGPKGIGALVFKNKNKLKPIIFGGGQEFNLRSGTENLPAIMSLKYVVENRTPNTDYITSLNKAFLNELNDNNIEINCKNGSPYILSLSFKGIRGETFVSMLSDKGVFVSTGSACSSKKKGNRILSSMGFNEETIISSVRVSFFESNTLEEVSQAGKIMLQTYHELKEKMNV